MRALIAGNWKMNGTLASCAALVGALRQGAVGLACDLLVCPPATLVHAAARALAGSAIAVGGQDCHARPSGAHTGDVSALQLRDAGATHVILGHSERRQDHGEDDALVRAKVEAAVAAGLAPIVCVGETRAEREAGRAEAVVGAQLGASLPQNFAGSIAYEPVWAIGTGLTPTEAEVAAMHGFIRARVGPGVRILYGGSVKPGNAAALLALPEVGGALVGGASLVAEEFLAIARAAPVG
jgi:triosephosphate isomerase